jgi:hypothetical protein
VNRAQIVPDAIIAEGLHGGGKLRLVFRKARASVWCSRSRARADGLEWVRTHVFASQGVTTIRDMRGTPFPSKAESKSMRSTGQS